MSSKIPLFVDLDGTVIFTDLVYESIFALLRKNPLYIFVLPFWFLCGRPYFKRKIANLISIDITSLPYNHKLIEYLKVQHDGGRKVILATASDQILAEPVANYLGVFDQVLGTEGKTNLKGRNKLLKMKEVAGSSEISYAGNSSADFPIWKGCKEGIVVSASPRFISRAKTCTNIVEVFESPEVTFKTLMRVIRVHQWVKNLLVFVPVIFGHKIIFPEYSLRSLIAFFSFSLTASAVYIINDLIDLPSDRRHPTKCKRPLANREFPISTAMLLAPAMLACGIIYSGALPREFGILLAFYFVLTLGYSLYLKSLMVVDVVLLASLYALRILAGGMATEIVVSKWLLAFAIFFFFSLACLKRYSELLGLQSQSKTKPSGRGYEAGDLNGIAVFGGASAYISILILALYISSAEVTTIYLKSGRLWFLIPIFLYWTSRIWLLAFRGKVNEDPILFALSDRISYLVGLATTIVVFAAL